MSEDSAETVRSPPAEARYQPLVIVLVAVCTGIVADWLWALPVGWWWAMAIVGAAAWFALWRCEWLGAGAVVLMLAVAATAAAWHHCRWSLFAADDLAHFARDADEPICLEAIALQVPRSVAPPTPDPMRAIPSGDSVRLDIAPLFVRDQAQWRPISGRARLTVSAKMTGIDVGDRLQIFARLARPTPAHNPGEFDYAEYLRSERIGAELHTQFAECISRIAASRPWNVVRWLERLRTNGNRIFAQYLDPRRAALASAVLLGQRELVDPEVTESLRETGSIHLVVIAGLHVGILAVIIHFLLRRLPISRGFRLAMVAALVVLYAVMVDAQPPVVRAAILVVASCWSLYLGRPALGFNTLTAAALVVLAINPVDLFHTGAQLSFLCVAALIWFAPQFAKITQPRDDLMRVVEDSESWLRRAFRFTGRRSLQLVLAGMVLWLTSAPLVMARFHLFTPVAPLANVLVIPIVEVGFVTGLATLALGSLAWFLGHLCGDLANISFGLLEWVVAVAKNIPGSHFWVPGPNDWWLAGFYGGLAVQAAFPRLRLPRRWCVAILAGWLCVGFGVPLWQRSFHRAQQLDCTFLSMSHGCAVVLELPNGQTVLYDAGRMGSPVAATRSIAGMLWSRGITHLDALVLSHGDLDHYNAVPGLLERFSVGVIYVSPVMFENDNPAMRALQQAIASARVPVRELRAGNELRGGPQCRIEVLHPPRHGILGNENANSVVLAVEYGGHRILLPGDLEARGIDELLTEAPLHCDVLLVPHHGSQQSNPPGLAAWCSPQWVVISGSRRWDTRPIRTAYQAVGGRVIETIDSGAVHATIASTGVRVESFLRR